jgi:hypothetical protein
MSNTRFWNATERAMADFTGNGDLPAFRRHMRRLGHDWSVIRDQVESIHPRLLPQWRPMP